MSDSFDNDIEEDLGSSSVKEESNQYYEDFQSSTSQIKESNENKTIQQQQNNKNDDQSKISKQHKSLEDEDEDKYDQDFEDEEQIDNSSKLKQQQNDQLKPTQAQMKQLSQQQGQYKLQKQENPPQELQDSLKNSINEDQLKKQQLSFIGNLNKFAKELQQNENQSLKNTQESLKLKNNSGNQNKSKNETQKPPIPTKQNYIKDTIEEKPKEKKNDIEQVPNDEEIEEIIRKNQQDFLQMIKKNSQKNSPVKSKEEVSEQDSENQYYDEEEDVQDLHVIYETDREDSQAAKSSYNNSFDQNYYSQSYGSSVYQQYSALHISPHDEDNQYYEDSQMKQKESIKSRKQTQNEYERIINQKKMELLQLQEMQKLKQQLNINLDLDEEQIKIAKKAKQKEREIEEIKILQERMRYGCRKCAEANTQKDREAYREENQHLRKVINEQEAQIKLLKVQLRKSGDRNLDNSFSSMGSVSTSFQRKMEELEFDKEKLKDENSQLRNQLKNIKKSASSQISRQQRLNNEIQKVMGTDIRKLQEKENKKPVDPNLEKQHQVLTERLAELRIDLEKMIKKYEDQKQKIKEKDELIITLKQKVQGRHFQKQVEKINELQAIVNNIEQDKEQIRDEMSLDKQLELLFPRQMTMICNFFNICIAIEEMRRGRHSRIINIVHEKAKPYINYFKKIFYIVKDSIKFQITKKPIHHPQQQEIIRATIKAWNESPEIVARQMRSQQKELKELRLNFIELSNEVDSLRERNELLQKDVEILRQRNSVLETRLTVDKNKLHHSVEDEEQDYLLELKKLINIIKEGPPLLISQAERDAFKKQQEIEAENERKKREREERKKEMALKKQLRLEEKREREEKEKEELLLQQKLKLKRPFSALKQKQNSTPQQNKDIRPNSAKNNTKKEVTQSIASIQILPSNQKLKEENVNNNQQDSLNKTKDSKNFRVSILASKSKQSLAATNNSQS